MKKYTTVEKLEPVQPADLELDPKTGKPMLKK